ncbi:MAG: hypothetical protein KZQ85_00100 [Candidatus Thiodiazotropha sp. (ex Myrtea sp. 'scaly one' KF741663)]|nr:hypothetical protein [Candidatus Thiodiazotropha sp. (ex Myrtea sp. 'scaly one' KF741663)]
MEIDLIDGIYKDGKWLAKKAFEPIYDKWKEPKKAKILLASFSEEFTTHPPEITSLVNYVEWHADHDDWEKGAGVLLTATYNEIDIHWMNQNVFAFYEAGMLNRKDDGWDIRRLFVFGPEILDPNKNMVFQHVLYRHHLLGLSPKVSSIVPVDECTSSIGVNSDAFLSLNQKVTCYIRFMDNGFPAMVRTTNGEHISRTESAFLDTWNHNSEKFDNWYKKQAYQLTEEHKKQIEHECNIVHEFAAQMKANNA